MVSKLSHVRENVKLFHGNKSLNMVALINTGATTLTLPKNLAEKLEVQIVGKIDVEMVDGTVRRVNYGVVEVLKKLGLASNFKMGGFI